MHLPECYGPPQTVNDEYLKWHRTGLWETIVEALDPQTQQAINN